LEEVAVLGNGFEEVAPDGLRVGSSAGGGVISRQRRETAFQHESVHPREESEGQQRASGIAGVGFEAAPADAGVFDIIRYVEEQRTIQR
jgi:hypothetical protein